MFNQSNGKFCFVLLFSISISKEKHILGKKNVHQNFYEKFLKVTIFEEMIFQQEIFDENFFSKFFNPNCFRGNDFATIKKFRTKLLIKIMGNFALYYDFPLVFLKRNIFQ